MRRLLQHKRKFLPLFIGLLLIGLLIGLTIPLTGLAVPAENKITDFFIKNPQESVGADKISLDQERIAALAEREIKDKKE